MGTHELPADFKSNALVHKVSKPPAPPLAKLVKVTATVPSKVQAPLAPPKFRRHLSDSAFLLEVDEEKEVVEEIKPPERMGRKLSDPSFLLEGNLVDDQTCDNNDALAFDETRSVESGSSSVMIDSWEPMLFQKMNTEKYAEILGKEILLDAEYAKDSREPIPFPVLQPTQPKQMQPKPQPKEEAPRTRQRMQKMHVVTRRRKPRKTIEAGKFYKTKRFVKVTKKEDPFHFGEAKRRERDPNEVWTVRTGVEMEVLEVQGKRAYVYCVVEFWSKYQDRTRDAPRQKEVEGWISLKDGKGWVL